jgi:hypothetical protein
MHQQIANPAQNESSPDNGSSVSVWENLMRKAVRASRAAQSDIALTGYRQALQIAHRLIEQPSSGRAGDCVAALVVSHDNLASLYAELGDIDSAAAHFCPDHDTRIFKTFRTAFGSSLLFPAGSQ